MKLLFAGDLHIGRSSSRVPEAGTRGDVRATAAWERIVDLAIEQGCAAICLSGDVADQDNRFWEAIGPLERGIERLAGAGIRVFAVAGNHDFDVLIRLADQLPAEHFTLLGRGGVWERATLHHGGRPALHIDGWSFPRSRVSESPLDSYTPGADSSVPVLGMVHGDLDTANSPYAPLDSVRLRSLPPFAWLLGHIHTPRRVDSPDGRWLLYPGSPQALDPAETGAHGVWLCEVDTIGMGVPEPRPLSSVWYDSCEVELTGTVDDEHIEHAVLEGLRRRGAEIVERAGPELAHISLRLRVAGSTPASSRVPAVSKRVVDDLSLLIDTVSLDVNAVEVETLPPIDLAEHAGTSSAPGAVARVLIELEKAEPSDAINTLIRRTREAMEAVERHRDFSQLEPRDITDEMARRHIETQARALLTELMAQTP